MTFTELYDRMGSAGIAVGVASDDGQLAITLDDGRRSIRYPVRGGIHHAAAEIVLSGRLRQLLGPRDVRRGAVKCVGSWPEFLALWPLEHRDE